MTTPRAGIGDLLFRHRGWIPVPFIVFALVYARPGEGPWELGVGIMGLGEILRLWGSAHLGKTARSSRIRTAKLVTTGPYARTRHPLYWGNLALTLGFTLASGAGRPWFPVVVGVAFVLLYGFHALREERALLAAFPRAYAVYRGQTPRFRWRRRPVSTPATGETGVPSLGQALRVEAWTIHAELWLLAALWARGAWF